MARLSKKRAAGKGSAVFGRVAKTPAGLALAGSRAVRFNRVADPGNINAIREILPFESGFGNIGRGLTAAPGWYGVAVNCNGIIILCQKVEEDIRALGPFGVIDGARTRGDENCSCAGVKSYVGRDAEGVAIKVFKVKVALAWASVSTVSRRDRSGGVRNATLPTCRWRHAVKCRALAE
ncbi:hypothetical protein GWK47_037292 [Chionoecetes opilio]|uniref:Uncharacterized protein n=1 Tax=Chionoecetes opilio TaxID=41210 RepID=A0A8J4YN77_CHIOP|nr:hypothetical protein GWK47_037292 [Chionoecetes opilio]